MALVGTYIKKEIVASETEFDEIKIVHPEYPADHNLYEKSGQEETIQQPKMNEIVTEFKDCYVVVRAASLHQRIGNGQKHWYVSSLVCVYKDEDDKNNNFLNDTYNDVKDFYIESLSDLDDFNNPMAYAYYRLKMEEGYELLMDKV